MTIRFVEEARQELLDAISYYEDIAPISEPDSKTNSSEVSSGSPLIELYRLRPGGYRRINLRIFPYYVAYAVRSETLWILAVAQSAREPLYWISRRTQTGEPNAGQ